jgi:hypothetical protein
MRIVNSGGLAGEQGHGPRWLNCGEFDGFPYTEPVGIDLIPGLKIGIALVTPTKMFS